MREGNRWHIGVLLLTLAIAPAWGQDPQSSPATQDSSQPASTPVPAYGQGNPVTENPPVSGLDEPGLEPHAAPLSYLQPGVHVAESADSNIGDTLGGSATHSRTDALGSVQMERLWSNYDLGLDYLGGVAYYNAAGLGFRQVEELNAEQAINWKRGKLTVRDCFSYLPEGNIAEVYGMRAAPEETPIVSCGGNQALFFGGSVGATLEQVSRIANLTLVDVSQYLSPKSSITVVGGYGFVHFLSGSQQFSNINFLGNTEVSGELAYNRVLGPHDQAAIVYAYQGFRFSTAQIVGPVVFPSTSFHTHVAELMWGHRISGRLNLTAAAGPQLTNLNGPELTCDGGATNLTVQQCQAPPLNGTVGFVQLHAKSLGVAGRFALHYRFPKTDVGLEYDRYTTAGSGFFAGAKTDRGTLSFNRPVTRVWSAFADGGYSKNVRLFPTDAGVDATRFSYTFAGGGLHRRFGREFRLFVSYQFNDLKLEGPVCGAVSSCTAIRNVGTVGVDWSPRPIRLD